MSTAKSHTLDPVILVIFGITGDLSKRYLLLALYHLVKQNILHEKTEIIGVTRGSMKTHELLEAVEQRVKEVDGSCDTNIIKKLQKIIDIRHMDLTDPKEYDALLVHMNELETKNGVHMDRLYYLSVPPMYAQSIVSLMGEHGLNGSCQHEEARIPVFQRW